MKNINYTVLLVAGIILALVGLKLTSMGSGPMEIMQNDGYNVTGGFLSVFGGALIGSWLFRPNSNKKSK